jgi:hypothetical protein
MIQRREGWYARGAVGEERGLNLQKPFSGNEKRKKETMAS